MTTDESAATFIYSAEEREREKERGGWIEIATAKKIAMVKKIATVEIATAQKIATVKKLGQKSCNGRLSNRPKNCNGQKVATDHFSIEKQEKRRMSKERLI